MRASFDLLDLNLTQLIKPIEYYSKNLEDLLLRLTNKKLITVVFNHVQCTGFLGG